MFLDGHNLYGIVTVGGYARQHIGAELVVRAYALFVYGHTYMALVDKERRFLGTERSLGELIRLIWRPHLCREDIRGGVLNHTGGIGRNAFAASTVPIHFQLIQVAMRYCLCRQIHLPHAVTNG